MTKQWLTLDRVLTWIGSAALLVLFIPTAAYMTRHVSDSVESGLVDRGRDVARALAPQLVEPILLENHLAIREILHRASGADGELLYFFVEYANDKSPEGDSAYFAGAPDLVKLWKENRNQVIRFNTQYGPVLDLSAPILNGQLGFLHVGLSRSDVTAARNRLHWILGTELVAAIGFVLIGARILSAGVSRPLHKLETMVSQFPQRSLGSHELKLSKLPELNALGKGFQEMARRLEALQREQAETQAAMIRAERLATVGEMSAGLAHEICNPLDGMLECLRYLEADPDKSARAGKYYPIFRDGLQRIGNIMGGMLTFARSGKKVTPRPYPMSDILENLKLLLLTGNKEEKVRFFWYCEDSCVCLCDPQGLAQASLNLVLNAREAAIQSQDPQVKICAQCDSDWVSLTVEDSGPGVPDELRERIFSAFFTTKEAGKGTGLGLSVSHQLIRAVGGNLELSRERSSLGGAKFLIRLPRARNSGGAQ